jgi:hypothetical protein
MNTHQNSQSLTERSRQAYEAPGTHPFHVGESYANRKGNYEVMQVAPPKMTIRYDDGEYLTADIVILARIWNNMQLPAERPELDPTARPTTRRPAAKPRTPKAAARVQIADD